MSADDIKALNQERYGQFADGYVKSQTHAKGADLGRLVELVKPESGWQVLDIATGGGHTALKFAPHVKSVVSSDLTPGMLKAARGNILDNGAENVVFSAADAELLPFMDNTFDLVTCRIAPHHFPDIFKFAQEATRVLKPGGIFIVQDHVLPDDEKAADYADAFEKLRDPSHVHALSYTEWNGLFLDVGLEILHTETILKRHNLLDWATRQGCDATIIERLQVLLIQAPDAVSAHMLPEYAGTEHATFCNHHIIIMGRKDG